MSLALAAANSAADAPMMDINTTPLIDVMLVLLVMIIITVPPASHKVPLDLPQGPAATLPDPVKNILGLDAGGTARWNGRGVSDAELAGLLGASAAMAPQPEIHFEPAALARYERVDQLLAMAKHSGVTKLGFVGNQHYAREF